MEPQQDADGIWYVQLPGDERLRFDSHAAAWRWLDRQERRPGWVTSKGQFHHNASYAVPERKP